MKFQCKIRGKVLLLCIDLQAKITLNLMISSFDILVNIVDKSSSLLTVILGDFNARSTSWWFHDKTTTVFTCLEAHITFHGFQQLISLPTHILPSFTSFHFALISCLLVVSRRVHPALHPNCHH